MPTQVVIRNISPGQPWSNDFGTFHPFTLTVDGIDQPVTVNRKPDSPALEAGQQVWLETKPGRNGLAGKIVQAPDGQPAQRQNGQARMPFGDDPTRHSIEAQVAIKAAVEYSRGFDGNPPAADAVGEVAKAFFRAMQEMQA